MKKQSFEVLRYDADEGKVFDWADLTEHTSTITDEESGEVSSVQEHLYAKTLYLGSNDSIDNYVEVDEVQENEDN